MFRQQGRRRTFGVNLSLAILLSFTAGAVNVAGFFAFTVLTTNVTGHVANLARLLVEGDTKVANHVEIWILCFFSGTFISSFTIDLLKKKNSRYTSSVPIIFELGILLFFAVFGGAYYKVISLEAFVGMLLFTMGMQNAIVSVVSGSVVRTSHLTGMFTDLGINLSRLIFASEEEKLLLNRKITLHLMIVIFFFLGGISGGFLFNRVKFEAFFLPVSVLVLALLYDFLRINYFIYRRKIIRLYYRKVHKTHKTTI
jgi:uncharacterized membrane protein YoaK (UPF0700 family)